jgi:hypothetical protein
VVVVVPLEWAVTAEMEASVVMVALAVWPNASFGTIVTTATTARRIPALMVRVNQRCL